MIIKKLSLKNFMCYYGDDNTFKFSDGLNIILGHNGDGKSTIFSAFKWMFNATNLAPSDLYSKKKYSEINFLDTFNVGIEVVVEQYQEEYTIEKTFNVTKGYDGAKISPIQDKIYVKNLTSGQNTIERMSISDLSLRVFPEEFRNFSMFETETETFKLVGRKELATLVQNFSDAKYYEKLEKIISDFYIRADRQYIKESRADEKTRKAIDELDKEINLKEIKKKDIDEEIDLDEKGIIIYENKISDLVANLGYAEDYKKIKESIKILNIENGDLKRKINERFTDILFDDYYFLIGFEKYISMFSEKIDQLRQKRNTVMDEEYAKFAVEKLKLENGITPLPPGAPSIKILNEFLRDNTCKICSRELDEIAIDYINKSIKLYEEQQVKHPAISKPQIFNHTFIEELGLLDSSFNIQEQKNKYSVEKIKSEIDFIQKKNLENKKKISENDEERSLLESQENDILNKAVLAPDILADILGQHSKYSEKLSDLRVKLGKEKTDSYQIQIDIDDLKKTRNKTLGQTQSTTSLFKYDTCLILQDLLDLSQTTKNNEYERFLDILSNRATSYLKTINTGEIVGYIKLIKRRDEIITERYNDDGSFRTELMDTGAVKITIPLSILFAIADIAAEIRDEGDEGYPMIFDAPTGRLSPDRERKFFEVLRESKKQRIVVTLRFLDSDDNGVPFVDTDNFSKIVKDKAFFIRRERPLDSENPSTINTNIHDYIL